MSDIFESIARARSAALNQRFEDARARAAEALELRPHCLAAWRILAWSQLEVGDNVALGTFQNCVAYDPEDGLSHVGQALWLDRHAQRESALAKMTRAWELDPSSVGIRQALGRWGGSLPDSKLADGIALVRAGRCEEATDALRHAAAQDPPDLAALLTLMSAIWPLGARKQTYNLAMTVLGVRPFCVKAMLFLAAVENANGHTLRTREWVIRAEQVDPGLDLYAEIVQQLGLRPVLERHATSRPALAEVP